MEFDDMKKIWDSQNNEMLFAINEDALHNRVKSKKRAANRAVNMAEIGLILINSSVTIYLFFKASRSTGDGWDFAEAGVLLITVVYLVIRRARRKSNESKFDRTMLGELNHAIASARSTLNLSYALVYGYFVPMGVFVLFQMIYYGASIEKWILIVGAYVLAFFLVGWERKRCHIPRVNRLMNLKKKLQEDF